MTTVIQRPLRGSRISSFYPVKSLPSLSSLDSAFQLQEYISLLIRLDVHDVDAIVSIPGKGQSVDKNGKEKEAESAEDGAKKDEKEGDKDKKNEVTVDEACWIYEQLRRLAQDLSHPLITMLQQECTRSSCPEMKAGEWLYLCVAHGNDGAMEQCCAIDYILHTIDSATALLNSPRAFPSRLQIPQTSHRHFSSLARRLGRIFAHAYFHHREAFEQAEAESSLYARFLALTSKFDLVPPEFLVIPSRVLHDPNDDRRDSRDLDVSPPRLLAAGVHPQLGQERDISPRDQLVPVEVPSNLHSGGILNSIERSKSKSPPGSRSESPRKVGRNRTDTMVFSEAYAVAEELAKADDPAPSSSPSSNTPSEPVVLEPPSHEPSNTDQGSEHSADEPSSGKLESDSSPAEPAQEAVPDVTPSSSTAAGEPVLNIVPISEPVTTEATEIEPVVQVLPLDGGAESNEEVSSQPPSPPSVEEEEEEEEDKAAEAIIVLPQESAGESPASTGADESPAPATPAEALAAVEAEEGVKQSTESEEEKAAAPVEPESPQTEPGEKDSEPKSEVEVDVAEEIVQPTDQEQVTNVDSGEQPTKAEIITGPEVVLGDKPAA